MTLPTVVKPEILHIDQLMTMISEGRLKLPAFQRPPVWKPPAMRKLFESISLQYPIGSLLFWAPEEPQLTSGCIGPIQIKTQAKRVSYILDGQQRLTTLYCALAPVTKELDWEWTIYYDLRNEEFFHLKKGQPPAHWFPLRSLLRTMAFLKACRVIEETCPDADALVFKAESLAQVLKNYKIPVNIIEGGTLAQAIDIFSRLNTLGKDLKPDHLISAFSFQEDQPRLNEVVDDIQETLSLKGFDDMHRMTIVKAILLADGVRVVRNDWEGIAHSMNPIHTRVLERVIDALTRSIDFLIRELNLGTGLLLPYAYQILLLVAFFLECENPSSKQSQKLVRWFLASAYSGWFSGANDTQINAGINDMVRLAEDEDARPGTLPDAINRYEYPQRFNANASRVRLLLLSSLSLNPRDLKTGAPLDMVALIKSRRTWYRIFEEGSREWKSDPANRILIPTHGLSVKGAILQVADADSEGILASHAISKAAFKALAAHDMEGFILERREQLQIAEQQFLKKWFG